MMCRCSHLFSHLSTVSRRPIPTSATRDDASAPCFHFNTRHVQILKSVTLRTLRRARVASHHITSSFIPSRHHAPSPPMVTRRRRVIIITRLFAHTLCATIVAPPDRGRGDRTRRRVHGDTLAPRAHRMGKPYGVHVNKYYVPDDVPAWARLNVTQASKKVAKQSSAAKKQTLGKKAKAAQKLANRKGGRGKRNPANKDFAKNLNRAKELKKTKRSGRQSKKPGR